MMFPFALLSILLAVSAPAIPERAVLYLPVLREQIRAVWPGLSMPAALAGQVEQETCPSVTHKKCWNPRAELKTKREYGFGLGQVTVTKRFNNFEEVKKLDAKLRSWKWEERYDPARQLRALVVMDRAAYHRLGFAANAYERLAFMLSAYNGGLGGVMQDRRLSLSAGVNPDKWFDNVERFSYKSKTKAHGYGQSFFEINRGYVRNILKVRMEKYKKFV